MTFEKGTFLIRGEKKETEEDKKKKYYCRASRSFLYHLNVPGNSDESADPKAEFNKGVAKITFSNQRKAELSAPLKI